MTPLLAFLLAVQAAPPDAPSVEEARRSIQEPLRLGRQSMGLQLINVTSTTTPEAEHIATGARCRFWYRAAEIRGPWIDDRAVECSSAGGWVNSGLSITSLRGPRRPVEWGLAPLLRAGPQTLEALAAATIAASIRNWSGAQAISAPRRLPTTSPAGRRIEMLSFAINGPGGAPGRTPQIQYSTRRLLIIDGWLFEVSASGPIHYRRELEGYAEAGVSRLIESLETAARLATFRAAP